VLALRDWNSFSCIARMRSLPDTLRGLSMLTSETRERLLGGSGKLGSTNEVVEGFLGS
jgi:hypothetical protein